MRTKLRRDDRPTHEFGDCEEFEELGLRRDEVGIAGVGGYAVKEIGLFIGVGGKNCVVDYSLEDLEFNKLVG